jgi:hypothetical protein
MGENPAFLVMRWHALTIGNGLRDLIKEHKIDLIVTIFGVPIIGMYLSEALYLHVMRNAAALRAGWPIVSMSGLGASGLLGLAAGWWGVSLMLKFAFAAWTAALPILVMTRLKSAGFAAFVLGVAEAALLGICVSIICLLIGVEHPGIDGLVVAVTFFLSFAASLIAHLWFICQPRLPDEQSRDAAVLRRLRYASDSGQLPGWESGLFDMLATLDQVVPRWVGRWVMDNRVLRRAAGGIAFLLCVAAMVAVASLVQRNAVSALIVGAVVAHAVFVVTLRSHPLASAILRCSPLKFVVAWAGVVRLPLVISVGYFVPLALIGFVADPAHSPLTVACALTLLAANGVFSLISANTPLFPNRAVITHGVALGLMLKGAFEINAWIVLPVTAFLVLMWRSARRRYRVYA